MTWYVCIADASVRAAALAAMAGVLTVFLRRNPAAEHALWTLVVIGMLALPVLRAIVPATYVYVVERPAATVAKPSAPLTGIATSPSVASPTARRGSATSRRWWPAYAAIVYFAGVILFAIRLLAGLRMTQRLLRRGRPIDAGVDVDVDVAESD